MKTPFRSVFFRIILVFAVGVAAFAIGLEEQIANQQIGASFKAPKRQGLTRGALLANPETARENARSTARIIQTGNLWRLIMRDPGSGLAELAKLPPGADTLNFYRGVFLSLGHDSKKAPMAAAMAFDLPPGPNRTAALGAVIEGWSSSDPQAVLDWASNVTSTDPSVLKMAMNKIAKQDDQPALAAEYLDKLTDASMRNQAIGTIATSMASDDPAAALDWLDQATTGDAYDTNVKNIFANLDTHNPAQSAALLDQVTEPDVRVAAIANLATTWGGLEPQAALAWANSLPDAEAAIRNAALSSIVTSWARNDPQGAAAWVGALPDGDQRAALLESLNQSPSK
jgi:hypothetical protein